MNQNHTQTQHKNQIEPLRPDVIYIEVPQKSKLQATTKTASNIAFPIAKVSVWALYKTGYAVVTVTAFVGGIVWYVLIFIIQIIAFLVQQDRKTASMTKDVEDTIPAKGGDTIIINNITNIYRK